ERPGGGAPEPPGEVRPRRPAARALRALGHVDAPRRLGILVRESRQRGHAHPPAPPRDARRPSRGAAPRDPHRRADRDLLGAPPLPAFRPHRAPLPLLGLRAPNLLDRTPVL